MNRKYKFAKSYYNWVIDSLTEDEKWEELAFFRLGVELMLRQRELLKIEWSQIEYPYVKNIEKSTKTEYKKKNYITKEISIKTYEALNKIWCSGCAGNIFKKAPYKYARSISESIGIEFHSLYLRKLGIMLLVDHVGNM